MLVRTTKRIAGFPPPGEVGEVDDERALAAVGKGDAEDMSSLSARLRRTPEIVTGGVANASAEESTGPSGDARWSAPNGVDLDLGEYVEVDLKADPRAWSERDDEHEAKRPNDGA